MGGPTDIQRLTAALSLLDGMRCHDTRKARDNIINAIDQRCREAGGRGYDDLPPLAQQALEEVE